MRWIGAVSDQFAALVEATKKRRDVQEAMLQ
jgi:hypothetical protein